jgi:hypothetical protein
MPLTCLCDAGLPKQAGASNGQRFRLPLSPRFFFPIQSRSDVFQNLTTPYDDLAKLGISVERDFS